VRTQILSSVEGNLGKRPGRICELLQDCANMPADCRLEPAQGSTPAPLDLCSVGGTTASTQIAGVYSPADFKPAAGSCADSSDCSQWTGQMCNKQVTTDVRTCSAGVEGVIALGTCVRTPCQTCKVNTHPCLDIKHSRHVWLEVVRLRKCVS
jgi:hypothetical protein